MLTCVGDSSSVHRILELRYSVLLLSSTIATQVAYATKVWNAIMVICPLCDDEFQDLRGLNGHLRFKHGLSGQELDRVYTKAKKEQRENQEMRRPPSISDVRDMVRAEVEKMGESLTAVEAFESVAIEQRAGYESSLIELVDEYRVWKQRAEALESARPMFAVGTSDAVEDLHANCLEKAKEAKKQLKEAWRNG